VNKAGLFAAVLLAGASAALGLAAPQAVATSRGAGPVTEVSGACAGQNAEVEQAIAPPHYVYEAWIGCGGEGFARSVDGGAHFAKPITLPDSSGSDDPAVAVAPDGTVYVSYLRYFGHHAYPVVAASFNHGATFPQVSSLIPHIAGNWGDRDFIAAGRGGTVYATWDYGPSAADVKIVCSPAGSCAFAAVDANAVIQKSTDHGKTWGPITRMQPGFPAGGGYYADIVVQPDGLIDALILEHPLDRGTFAVHPGHELFTSSSDGGKTWRPAVEIGRSAGTTSDTEWWIDGDLSTDQAGNLYATWDTQTSSRDIGWLSYSGNGGRTWSRPVRVTPDTDSAMHNTEVAGGRPGIAYVAWQTNASSRGYATYLRPYSITRGWLGPAIRVSSRFGSSKIWPGDTFGIAILGGGPSTRIALSWGSAIGSSKDAEIYESTVASLAGPDRCLASSPGRVRPGQALSCRVLEPRGTLSLLRQRLAQSQMVAAGVADAGVADAVGLVDGFLEDLRPGGAQRLEGFVQVVDLDEDREIAFGDNLAHSLPVGRGYVVVHGGKQQFVGVIRGRDGEPAHLRAHRDILTDLEAQPLRVEGERLIQVNAVHGRVRDGKCHASDPTRGQQAALLRSCMAPRSTPGAPRPASCTAGPA
jgi:hypothetical protein